MFEHMQTVNSRVVFITKNPATKRIADLNKFLEARLGSHGGANEIKKHPFFKGFDWDNVRNKVTPFVPEVRLYI